jgi:FKBP-type peptidyl-prolyl cis-trans isomerase
MAKKSQRIIALSAAILFILTSVGFTGAVIWQMQQENKAVNDAQPLEQQQDGLKGTQLQGFTPVAEVTELQKIDLAVGTGAEVKEGATITANYTGAVASTGKIFESSYDSGQPVTFGLSQVIPGWTQGVPGMKEGGKRRLVIPAALAYGAQSPSPDIPANAALVFDIELISIK